MAHIEFSELNERLLNLENHYLPPISPTSTYTSEQQDDLRALRLLAHAEIEEYLEGLCELLLKELQRQCESRSRIRQHPSSIHLAWANKIINASSAAINQNNGVKAGDLKKMFEPFGLNNTDFDKVDPIFLDRMSDFGRLRGDCAHKSSLRASHSFTPQAEKNRLTEIKTFLADFDKLVQRTRLLGFF